MTREYPRLKALVMLHRSAESLDLAELLSLAEDPAAPPSDDGAYEWTQRFAIPIIRELHRKLVNTHQQVEYKPELICLLRRLRKAQRDRNRDRDKDLVKQLEAEVDMMLADELQPSLFAESAVS